MKNTRFARYTIFSLLFSFHILCVRSQVKIQSTQEQLWLAYFNQTRLSDRWGTWTDLHFRTRDNIIEGVSRTVVRVGLTYYLTDRSRLTAGYAWFNNFPGENHRFIHQVEHRLWQQWQWQTIYPRIRTTQAFRLEERFRQRITNDSTLGRGYSFNYRIRWNFLLQIPLNAEGKPRPGGVSLIVNDELFVNFGKSIVYNYFDQNRFFIGMAWHLNERTNFQFGYMNLFQQLAAGNVYKNDHDLRVSLIQNLDLRKGKH